MEVKELSTLEKVAIDFPLDHVVKRYAKDNQLSIFDAERHFVELRRFLLLCGVKKGKQYGMRGQIDEAWHTFLLFTADYSNFCQQIAGRFIHHQPDIDKDYKAKSSVGYELFLNDYKDFFNEEAPIELWPRPVLKKYVESGCGGCSGCGVDAKNSIDEYDGCSGCNGCTDNTNGAPFTAD